jgi:hypothetical protein
MSVVIVESSGNSLFDDSAERAVRKASPLPVPKDPGVFKQFRSFSLEFAPFKELTSFLIKVFSLSNFLCRLVGLFFFKLENGNLAMNP